eukprot:CAMPEP_0119035262 /NCGR_PEP_ID=MMETSP1177-20130426/2197_1 /TAXON_ID=2985 /ORGANISM="Ochromonas sp, Strain CCMP1899" /LENGTH=76 /DNA_ID=CAMNT_0006993271 /DNA_START=70 /DNA_END=300 /DNA_ORIENTATION=+
MTIDMLKSEGSQKADAKGILECKTIPDNISKSKSFPTASDPKPKGLDTIAKPKLARALSDKFASDYKNEIFDNEDK